MADASRTMAGLSTDLNVALDDRYSIERLIGSGGMAFVYLARDHKHDRNVALKVLRPDVAHAIGTERFLREIEIVAGLAHPHILPLHDSGEAQGFLYYVMPYVEGQSLRQRLNREKPLPLDQALQITRSIADALAYAHRMGVVHRDIKPENILFEAGHAVLSDFGIALLVSDANREAAGASEFVVGTPAYMSPEQASGQPHVDGRSDVYSLGCVLFELLAGEPPFSGLTPQAILAQQTTTQVRSISALGVTVPRTLDTLLAKALARSPAERFRTMSEMAAALASPDTVGPEENSIAVLPFTLFGSDPAGDSFADGITEEIINALSQLPGLRVVARTSAFAFKGRQEDLRSIGRSLNVTKVLEGSVRRAGRRLRVTAQLINAEDGYHLWSQRYDREVQDIFAIQDEIANAIARHLQGTLQEPDAESLIKTSSGTQNIEAYELYLRGRKFLSERGRSIVEGLRCLEQAARLDPEYAPIQAGLADAYSLLGLYGLASPDAMEKGRAAAIRALAQDESLPDAHASLGFVHLISSWDWNAAHESLQRALQLNPNAVDARCWYALFLAAVHHRFDDAIQEIEETITLDPLSSHPLGYLGIIYLGARRYDEGLAALESRERNANSFLFTWMLGMLRDAAGRSAEAVHTLESAAAMSGRHPFALGSIGIALARSGRRDEAEAVLDELLARARREYVPPMVFMALCAVLDCQEDSLMWLERAYEMKSPGLPIILMWSYYDPLREDPRFRTIASAMKLPQP